MPTPLTLHPKQDVYTGGTAEDFALAWAGSPETWALASQRRQPYYCAGCSVADFPHWEMGFVDDDAFARRRQVSAPT